MKHPLALTLAIGTVLSPLALPLASLASAEARPPAPYGALPSERQLAWHELEYYGFVHFTVNTFTGKEWGYGDESPDMFNPSAFDADQIVGTMAKAGMKGVIFTAKHHDGFCLWPTETTLHNIRKSPWKNGQGDMVREIADACRRHGVKFGVYVSPWDRNHPEYGRPAYLEVFRGQLRELLTGYGEVFQVWLDGANGGDGYYGGARERREIDRMTYYDWPETWARIRTWQPGACLFSDLGPEVRWVGNEKGVARYPCWATFTPVGRDGKAPAPGATHYQLALSGTVDGKHWIPAEADVSIRPGWFWHERENHRVRSAENLMDLYFASVGRGASFLLNVPPDRRGLLHERDVASLMGFKALRDALFARNLMDGARIEADATRGPTFAPEHLLDGDKTSYWSTPDHVTTATLTATLPEPRIFSVVRLREAIALGQRVRAFAVDVTNDDGHWQPWFPEGSSIGAHVLLRGEPVRTDRIRLRITAAAAPPCLSEFSMFLESRPVQPPTITRRPAGMVTILGRVGEEIRFTTDGSGPTRDSPVYQNPFALPRGGTVKARSFRGDQASAESTTVFGLASAGWKATASFAAREHPAAQAIDGNPATLWCTNDEVKGELGPPQWIAIDLGEIQPLAAVTILPRQDGSAHALVDRYRLEWSADGESWSNPAEGEFSNIRSNPVEQVIPLPAITRARHLRFTALRVLERNNVTLAEIGVRVADVAASDE